MRDDALGALALGLQRGQRPVDLLGGHALSLEIEPDRGVALPPLGQGSCAIAREPPVVHDAGVPQPSDGLLGLVWPHSGTRQPLAEPLLGEVPPGERARGEL